MKSIHEDIADPILYRTYFSLMMSDILHKQGFDASKENKAKLHEFHKQILGYKTIAGRGHKEVSLFLFEVSVYWATEKGIFVRMNKNQPYDMEQRPLKEVWGLL